MAFYERGTRVEITNKKHKHAGKRGKVTSLDRGNVTVTLDDGTVVVTRMASLSEINVLEKMAEAAAATVYRITKSPFEEDYEDDNPPPWDYEAEGLVNWVWEVFHEAKEGVALLEPDQAVELLRDRGYEVEMLA